MSVENKAVNGKINEKKTDKRSITGDSHEGDDLTIKSMARTNV